MEVERPSKCSLRAVKAGCSPVRRGRGEGRGGDDPRDPGVYVARWGIFFFLSSPQSPTERSEPSKKTESATKNTLISSIQNRLMEAPKKPRTPGGHQTHDRVSPVPKKK